MLIDLFGPVPQPVMVAWGAGVDSTAMLIKLVNSGQRIDVVLFADTGAEKPATYAFVTLFRAWLEARGIRVEIVRYQPANFKHFPPYRSLDENCFTNGTLPSISFGFSSCSQKWKIAPQDKWTEAWEPAQRIWAAGGKVLKYIGYDAGPRDKARYAHAAGYTDGRYEYEYPLQQWGWDRERCEAECMRELGVVPPKSACYMCCATQPEELHEFVLAQLRRIVLMEAVAAPRLRNIDGLWRKAVKGCRGATPKPGDMTSYIRDQGLLPAAEIDHIIAMAPGALVAFKDSEAGRAVDDRDGMAAWLRVFDDRAMFDADGVRPLYETIS